MATCPACAEGNPDGSRFCAACGSPLVILGPPREVRKTVTILFADVTGSTALGEQLDPESLRAIMARYFAMMKTVIERHGGTVEKFIGDAVMAVFGIPTVHEDDALRAVRAAAAIGIELEALNAELLASRGIMIRFRTGLNTGEVVAGDPASGQTLVTGDTVNTAARLEQAAPPGEILLGALTWSLVRDAVEVEPVEPIAAKGKAAPLAAYRLVSVRPGAAGRSRRLDAPLVGRERELERLAQAFRQTVADRACGLFTLLGSAGVGKSRLVAEFEALVGAEARVLHGHCLSYGEGITYWPIGEIVRAAAGITEADSAEAARAKVRELLAGEREADILAARISSAIGLSGEAAPQEEIFWAIRKLCEHLARVQPLVVVVEDIHWAEATLLDLLEHIADWSRDAPLLVLCPARPELLDGRTGWGGGKLNATTVLLEALPADATGRLITALPGGQALPDPVVERITFAAEGNPLYVEELLAMLVDDGLLRELPDGTWAASPDIAEVRVPPTISALLAARLEQLEPAERAVAERASVVGRVFEQAAVAELSDETLRPAVGRSLLALVRKELVRPDRSELSVGDAFRFRHILIRDAAYGALPKADRAALHERFADWLEATAGERLAELEEIVGHHLAEAHRYRTELGETGEELGRLGERAGERLVAAGLRARDLGNLPAAVVLLSRFAAIGSEADDRAEVLIDLGDLLPRLGRFEEAKTVLLRAADLSRARGEFGVAALADALWTQYAALGEGSATVESITLAARTAIAALQVTGNVAALGRAEAILGLGLAGEGNASGATDAYAASAAHLLSAGQPARAARVDGLLALAMAGGPTPVDQAIVLCDEIISRHPDDPHARSPVLEALGLLHAMGGNCLQARARIREALEISERLGQRTEAMDIRLNFAEIEYLCGDPAAATALATEVCDLALSLGYAGLAGAAGITQGRLSLDAGDLDTALRKTSERQLDAPTEGLRLAVRAVALARTGGKGATKAAQRALRIASNSDSAWRPDVLFYVACALDNMGQGLLARATMREAIALYDRKGNIVSKERAGTMLQSLGKPDPGGPNAIGR